MLQAVGYVVTSANSGAAAVDILRKERFDMMVVDYNMPGVTGFGAFMRGELAQESR